jgi:hypothetical protein
MVQNHHIATQLAAERQRDLRAAAGRGWRLSDLFRRRRAERTLLAAVPGADPVGRAGGELTTAEPPAAAPHARPELRVRRGSVGVGPGARPREARAPERIVS